MSIISQFIRNDDSISLKFCPNHSEVKFTNNNRDIEVLLRNVLHSDFFDDDIENSIRLEISNYKDKAKANELLVNSTFQGTQHRISSENEYYVLALNLHSLLSDQYPESEKWKQIQKEANDFIKQIINSTASKLSV